MAQQIKLKARDAIDLITGLCPGPLRNGCEAAGATFAAALGSTADQEFVVPMPPWVTALVEAKEALEAQLAAWKQQAEDLQKQLDALPPAGPPALPGGDPMEPLRRIAESINEAERLLNGQNLVIAGGTAEVSLTVDVGGAAAQASLHLDIQPRPQP